jgi:hypothetical protein
MSQSLIKHRNIQTWDFWLSWLWACNTGLLGCDAFGLVQMYRRNPLFFLKIDAAFTSETLVSTTLHGAISHKTITFLFLLELRFTQWWLWKCYLVACDAVLSSRGSALFRRKMLSQCSESKSKPVKPARRRHPGELCSSAPKLEPVFFSEMFVDFFLEYTEDNSFVHSFMHQWLYSPLLGPGLFNNFLIFFYTDGRTVWTSDQPVARPLPIHRTTLTRNKRTHRHGIRTHDLSIRASEDSSWLRPRGHCDRPIEDNTVYLFICRLFNMFRR